MQLAPQKKMPKLSRIEQMRSINLKSSLQKRQKLAVMQRNSNEDLATNWIQQQLDMARQFPSMQEGKRSELANLWLLLGWSSSVAEWYEGQRNVENANQLGAEIAKWASNRRQTDAEQSFKPFSPSKRDYGWSHVQRRPEVQRAESYEREVEKMSKAWGQTNQRKQKWADLQNYNIKRADDQFVDLELHELDLETKGPALPLAKNQRKSQLKRGKSKQVAEIRGSKEVDRYRRYQKDDTIASAWKRHRQRSRESNSYSYRITYKRKETVRSVDGYEPPLESLEEQIIRESLQEDDKMRGK